MRTLTLARSYSALRFCEVLASENIPYTVTVEGEDLQTSEGESVFGPVKVILDENENSWFEGEFLCNIEKYIVTF